MGIGMAVAVAACADPGPAPRTVTGGDAARGLVVMERVGCAACHEVPGIDWPRGTAGGSLAGFADRPMIAGRAPNRPDVLVRWIRDAPSVAPDVAMPAMPLTEAEARDLAAWLYEQHDD
jgi:cytochrome c1